MGRRRSPINQTIISPSELSQKIPGETKIERGKTNCKFHRSNTFCKQHGWRDDTYKTFNPRCSLPSRSKLQAPPKLIRPNMPRSQESSQSSHSAENTSSDINLDFEENSPFQEDVIAEAFQRPDKQFFQKPHKLNDLINTSNLIQKFLLKQADIDIILKVIQRKVLKGTHLPVEIKEIQAGYLSSFYFKDIYLYLVQNKLPTTKAAIRKVETLAEWYICLDSLLFKITPEKETAVLAVQEICTDKIITLYHSSLFVGHQGVIKTYLTISDKYFIPNLIHYLRSYIKGCHIFQLACNEKPTTRQLQTRINPNYIPLSRLSMDLKVIPRSYRGHNSFYASLMR